MSFCTVYFAVYGAEGSRRGERARFCDNVSHRYNSSFHL